MKEISEVPLKIKKNFKHGNFRVSMSFYSPDGNALSMPLACLSSYIKKYSTNTDVFLTDINVSKGGHENTVEGVVDRIKLQAPDLLAFSCMSPHWDPLQPYLVAIREAMPDITILIGGYQAIFDPEETISHKSVDYICVGDGEKPMLDLIDRLKGTNHDPVEGMWEKKPCGEILKSKPVLMNDFSELPFPDYDFFKKDDSLRNQGFSIFGPRDTFILPVMTGRGCPYKCTYCSNTPMLDIYRGEGSYIRKYDPQSLVDEMNRLRYAYNVGYFEFWDELFLSNMKFSYEFLELYKSQIGIPFSINSRVEKMDEEFCKTAKEAGCHTIWFGIESGSETYRNTHLGRKMTNNQIISAARHAQSAGIRCLTFNIVGMPFETKENMIETLEINRIIRPEYFFFFPYIPLKGTPLYNLALEHGLLKNNVAEDYQEGLRKGVFEMNINEHQGGISLGDFQDICMAMKKFQDENNRLNVEEV